MLQPIFPQLRPQRPRPLLRVHQPDQVLLILCLLYTYSLIFVGRFLYFFMRWLYVWRIYTLLGRHANEHFKGHPHHCSNSLSCLLILDLPSRARLPIGPLQPGKLEKVRRPQFHHTLPQSLHRIMVVPNNGPPAQASQRHLFGKWNHQSCWLCRV